MCGGDDDSKMSSRHLARARRVKRRDGAVADSQDGGKAGERAGARSSRRGRRRSSGAEREVDAVWELNECTIGPLLGCLDRLETERAAAAWARSPMRLSLRQETHGNTYDASPRVGLLHRQPETKINALLHRRMVAGPRADVSLVDASFSPLPKRRRRRRLPTKEPPERR